MHFICVIISWRWQLSEFSRPFPFPRPALMTSSALIPFPSFPGQIHPPNPFQLPNQLQHHDFRPLPGQPSAPPPVPPCHFQHPLISVSAMPPQSSTSQLLPDANHHHLTSPSTDANLFSTNLLPAPTAYPPISWKEGQAGPQYSSSNAG